MTQFKGIFQVTRRKYDAMSDSEKSGYLFLVREGDYVSEAVDAKLVEGSAKKPEIYFGKRKYATNSDAFVDNVVATFGGLMDVDGGFVLPTGDNFVNIDESGVDSLLDLFKAVDAAISTITAKFDDYYTESEIDAKVKTLNEAIAECLTAVSVKVGETVVNGVDGQIDLTDIFNAAGKVKDVTVDGESVMDGTTAKISLEHKANKSVVDTLSDKVTALEAIKHATDVVYDEETKYIQLKGADGNAIGKGFDASPFIVDGMIDSVSFVKDAEGKNTTTLQFVFNTDGGKKTIDVDFSKYVDTYHADNTSIELDSTTNTFSVKEVDASKTKLSTSIEVNGGPLADDTSDNWPWTEDGKKVIPAGKTMEEILTSLFLKIIEGTVSFGGVSWSPGVAQPTVTLSKSGTIEVGTKVKATALTNGAFNKAKRSITLTTTQGYFDGDTYSSDKSKTFYSAESTASGTETISCTWNTAATDVTVNETELVTVEGTNTLTATQSGLVATVSKIPNKTVYASTNTKTKLTDTTASKKQVASISESQETYTSDTLSNSKSATVTAYYPIYTNGKTGSNGTASSETALVANDGTKLGLVADNTVFYVNFAPMIDGGTGYRLLVKSGKKITEAMALNTLNSKYEVDMKSSFVKAEGTVDKASGDTTFAYDVYEAKGSAGANAIRFKID